MINTTIRPGLKDMWNSFMVKDASFSPNGIPICNSTYTGCPKALIGFDEAKTIHNKQIIQGNPNYHVDAFIHFYIDDQHFDGPENSIWLHPYNALEIIKHFSGIITPDFSTYADFPDPLLRWNYYRMNAFGCWIASLNIHVINNCRWGLIDTWDYCFDGTPCNSIVAIGTVASNIRLLDNRPLFEDGFSNLLKLKAPHTLLFYGSINSPLIEAAEASGIRILHFRSKTDLAFSSKKEGDNE